MQHDNYDHVPSDTMDEWNMYQTEEVRKQGLDKHSPLTFVLSNLPWSKLPFCQSCYPVQAMECH